MSVYSDFEGTIRFKDLSTYKKAVEMGLNSGNFCDFDLDTESFSLKFPDVVSLNDGTKNLGYLVDELCLIGFKGRLIGTCTDGEERGFVIDDGEITVDVDLIDWGIVNVKDYQFVTKEEIEEEEEDDPDNFNELINHIAEHFHNHYK